MTCGPAVRRVLEESEDVTFHDMDWDEHWAEVSFLSPSFGLERLRERLRPAGAWCEEWT